MSETRNERILYKMSSEIANMMKIDLAGVDRVAALLKGFHKDSLKSTSVNLKRFYTIVQKQGVKQKQRRGIGYKVDLVIRNNERIAKEIEDPGFVKIEKPTFFSSNKFS
jgi:hypothetical protein